MTIGMEESSGLMDDTSVKKIKQKNKSPPLISISQGPNMAATIQGDTSHGLNLSILIWLEDLKTEFAIESRKRKKSVLSSSV